jgi:hypothetical protein
MAAGGKLRAAGANVHLGSLADVGGPARIAGANIVVDGHLRGDAEIDGAIVTINGIVDGKLSVNAQRLVVGPQAVLGNGLFVRSLSEPEIDGGARITGDVTRERPVDWLNGLPPVTPPVFAGLFAASIILIGIVFLIFARSTFAEAVDHVRFRPLGSVLFGIVTVLLLIILAGLLMGTLIGFGLGLGLVLLLPIVCVLAQPVAVAGILGWVFGRRAPTFGVPRLLIFLIVGALLVAFAAIIPVTGPWIVLVAFVFGLGGVLRAMLWRFRRAKPVPLAVGQI